jgi:hypothetical protein
MSRVGSATFSNMSVISWWRKLEYPGKTTDLSQVTDTFNVVSSTARYEWDSNSHI